MTTDTLRVELGARSYDVLTGSGLLAETGALTAPLIKGRRAFVVTDENVAPRYLATVRESFEDAGFSVAQKIMPPGEGSKSWASLGALLEAMVEARMERSSVVVALGGGVIGDVAGFAAAILLRGVNFVQIPTTVLSQADSALGGKTAVNARGGKNLIGAFHQPRLVVIDAEVLKTLPKREIVAGYAEVAKYGLIDDPAFWTWLEENGERVLALDGAAIRHALRAGCAAKARVVARDERENGARAVLNLGHTFGHALEAEGGYDGSLLHGEAVAVGMTMAFDLSVKMGLCPPEDAARVRAHLSAVGLPTVPPRIDGAPMTARALMDRIASDKKVLNGKAAFVLCRGIGRSFLSRAVDPADVFAILCAAVDRAAALP